MKAFGVTTPTIHPSWRPQRRFGSRTLPAIAFFIMVGVSNLHAQSHRENEYRMKAVYLFNFLKFVEWPDKQFDNGTSPFILVLLGDDPFGNVLDEAIGSEKVGNHPIIVKRIHSLKNLDFCHALFVTSSVREDLDEIFMRVGESPILTISDISNFADRGGAIGVYEENSRIRFSINLHTMKRADLKASSKLLRLARVIDPL